MVSSTPTHRPPGDAAAAPGPRVQEQGRVLTCLIAAVRGNSPVSSCQGYVKAFSWLSKLATEIKMSFLFLKTGLVFVVKDTSLKTAMLLSPHIREEGKTSLCSTVLVIPI